MRLLRHNVARVAALGMIIGAAWLAQLPSYSAAERHKLAKAFVFHRYTLVSASSRTPRSVRLVEPQLEHIRSWISAVGAAVALSDADGNGLPDDVCLVDPRTDSVTVEPAPGTGQRYRAFLLDPAPLRYDPRTMAPMGCLPGDFNGDGRPDYLVYYWGRTPVLFLRRPGTALGPSGYVRKELVPGRQRWYTDSIAQADVDGDGKLDLIVGNYFPDGSRVLDPSAVHDPLMQMQDSMSRAFNGGVDRILLRTGPARFREVPGALSADVARGWTLAIGAASLHGGLLPDIYFANDFGPDRLLYNTSMPGHVRLRVVDGVRGFTTPASKVLGTDSFKGMGVDFADVNSNGRLDIFVSNITSPYALEESNFMWMADGSAKELAHGVAPYTDDSEPMGLSRSGWSWDAKFGDFADDGRLELVQAAGFLKGAIDRWPELQELAMANDTLLHDPSVWPRFAPGDALSGHQPFHFWVRGPGGRFVDLASQIGLEDSFPSRGVATGDVKGNGALDFLVADQWGPSYLFMNQSPRRGRFLGLDLLLPPDGRTGQTRVLPYPAAGLLARPAVGATALVHLHGRTVLAQVDGGNGHASVRAPELLFGLGRAWTGHVPVDVQWRDASGHVHSQHFLLRPGWHTVVLAQR